MPFLAHPQDFTGLQRQGWQITHNDSAYATLQWGNIEGGDWGLAGFEQPQPTGESPRWWLDMRLHGIKFGSLRPQGRIAVSTSRALAVTSCTLVDGSGAHHLVDLIAAQVAPSLATSLGPACAHWRPSASQTVTSARV